MMESKALAQVAVRLICLLGPLRLNVGASPPCRDSRILSEDVLCDGRLAGKSVAAGLVLFLKTIVTW